jgi:hypothetical protein
MIVVLGRDENLELASHSLEKMQQTAEETDHQSHSKAPVGKTGHRVAWRWQGLPQGTVSVEHDASWIVHDLSLSPTSSLLLGVPSLPFSWAENGSQGTSPGVQLFWRRLAVRSVVGRVLAQPSTCPISFLKPLLEVVEVYLAQLVAARVPCLTDKESKHLEVVVVEQRVE